MGRQIPAHRPIVAAKLGTDHSVFRLSRSGPQDHLHDQRHRKPEHEPAQDHQKPGPFPQRRRRHQAFVPGLAQCREKVDQATQTMETGAEPVRRPVPGPLSIVNILTMEKRETVAYTEDRTLPPTTARILSSNSRLKSLVPPISRVEVGLGT